MQENATQTGKPGNRRRRLAALVILGLALIGGVLAYRYFWLARPVGKGPAGPAVDRAPFEKAWTDRKVLVLGLGDSVTAGFGARPDYGYVARLVDNPADEWPEMRGLCLRRVLPNLTVENLAVSGSNSIDHLERIQEDVKTQPADVLGLVVMTSGGNDLIHWYGRPGTTPREGAMYKATMDQARPWIAAFEKRLGQMLDLLDERFPGGRPVAAVARLSGDPRGLQRRDPAHGGWTRERPRRAHARHLPRPRGSLHAVLARALSLG